MARTGRRTSTRAGAITFGLVGYLFVVELVSGVLQGFYVPLIPDLVEFLGIRDADFNWFEAAQLLLSAIVVPVLAKLGDIHGHKRILLASTAVTAAASWWLAFTGDFTTFLIAWALQGFYVVWLPLEVALTSTEVAARQGPRRTRDARRVCSSWPSRPVPSSARSPQAECSVLSATAFPRRS